MWSEQWYTGAMMAEYAVYVHVPFCKARCSYCDFNTYAGLAELMPVYCAQVLNEFRWLEPWMESPPATLYLGGGTPSLLAPEWIGRIVKASACEPDAEISMEANPGTLNLGKLRLLRRTGINRLSMGMQSALERELQLLGRWHTAEQVRDAVSAARTAGFDNLNLDLIYGLPGQTLADWETSLRAALALEPEHFSLYALTVEEGTLLHEQVETAVWPEPDPDLAADMYELACELLAGAGYSHYEISNWARPNYECLHNLFYWRNERYVGLGAGAWGHWPDGSVSYRPVNVRHPRKYVRQIKTGVGQLDGETPCLPATPATAVIEEVSPPMAMAETMFMGLRLLQEGVSRDAFRRRFNVDPLDVYATQLAGLAAQGKIEWDEKAIRLLLAAVLTSNQVFTQFLPDEPA